MTAMHNFAERSRGSGECCALLTSHHELRALGDEGVALGEVGGGDLALPHTVVVLDVGLPHPQRAVALGHAAVPLVLVLVHPHRGPVLLPPTLTALNTNIFYKSTIYFYDIKNPQYIFETLKIHNIFLRH